MRSELHQNIATEFDAYQIMPNGILKIKEAVIAHIGDLVYPDETLYVDRDTLFDPGHIRSLEGAYLTIEHPAEKVNPINAKKYAVGNIGKIKDPDLLQDNLVADLIVWDIEGIKAIANYGFKFLSESYFTKRQLVNGRITQRHRKTNHVALTKNPRAKNAIIYLGDTRNKILRNDSATEKIKNRLVSVN